jgi:hypothetical protein
MRLVASEIADSVWADPSQDSGDGSQLPVSTIPVEGYRDKGGRWRDGLTERTGMSRRGIARALEDLAGQGYEMRQQMGMDKHGRPVYATKGHALRFVVPPLPPRPEPQRLPSTSTFSPVDNGQRLPSTSGFEAPKGDVPGKQSAPKVDVLGNPMSFKELPLVKPPPGSSDPSGAPVETSPATSGQDQVLNMTPGKGGRHRAPDGQRGIWPAEVEDADTLPLPKIRHARARQEALQQAAQSRAKRAREEATPA